ncbi:MAG: hypothetical protein MUE51_06145 [Thermoleophilia bacterium]|jgi:hypothetical protein|nr:hypothetical protein [Thermoleophilia bacterium]
MIPRSNRLAAAAAALLLGGVGLVGGCGGGGGGESTAADTTAGQPVVAGAPGAAPGAPAGAALGQAVVALGAPQEVSDRSQSAALTGLDRFGTPKDVFHQQVREAEDGGAAASASEGSTGTPATAGGGTAAPPPGGTPIDAAPVVAVPGTPATAVTPAATPGTPAAPGTPSAPADPTTSPAPSTPVTTPNALEADFDISGEPVVAREGDAIPPDTQQFTVKTIGAKSVVLQLAAGLLPDGTDTVTLEEGESITLYNQTARQSYKVKLVDVRAVGA